ncbi:helix-turn-helix domain-containing protein [Fictibacillus barbaricus]|uniref:Transcriptional regulator with XRE-family HTH domain n=1 Tax=Fictibacillus barbaricus TaxID=182136 RepID=A0ABU1U1B3_9BACL|nr:helix-turn-helix transcriptional regulator [Fictibacillus barbaricus]MDR7073270.1 transcriptional regulator with XRE-family HTH domain [Fictibacillus barbaricus]
MNLGEKIRYFRRVKNLSQQELAAGICSIPYLSKIENGVTEPSEEIQQHLAERLEIRLDTINEDEILRNYVDLFYSLYQLNYQSADEKFKALAASHTQSVDEEILHKIFKCIYLMQAKDEIQPVQVLLKEVSYIDSVINGEKAYYYFIAKGLLSFYSNSLEEALHYFFTAEKQLEENRFQEWEHAYLFYMIGLTANNLHKNIVALEYTKQALDIFEKNYFFKRSANCRIIIAIIHLRIKNFDESTKQLLLAETIANSFNEEPLKGMIYHNLGSVATHKGENDKAIKLFSQSLKAKEQVPLAGKIMTIYALIKEFHKTNCPQEGLNLIEIWLEQVQADPIHREYELHFLYHKQLFTFGEHNEQIIQFMVNELIPYFQQRNEWMHLANYYPIIGKYFESNQKYKQASMYYSYAFESMRNMHEMGVTYL